MESLSSAPLMILHHVDCGSIQPDTHRAPMDKKDLLILPPAATAAAAILRGTLRYSAGISLKKDFCQIRLYPIYFLRGAARSAHTVLEQTSGSTSATAA